MWLGRLSMSRFGRALLVSTLVGFVVALWGVLASESGLIALAPFVGFVAFALYLANSAAPLPALIEEEPDE